MLNVAVLMGRLVADPELRHTQSDIAVCSFRVAVDRNFSTRSGERQTDFIDVVAWRQTAEFVCKYFTKGQMIAVNGSIQTRPWEDKQGNKRTAVEVVAENVSFCGSKRESGGGNAGAYEGGGASYGGGNAYGNAPSYNRRQEQGFGQEDRFDGAPTFHESAPAFSNGDFVESDPELLPDGDIPF
ncbi:single-stranded DNA-binding protein [Acutalibacter caecimuris]|uniref:single-stranded DNA-binding protein n=1 Tax=Acutalibacter caecimuris TaxID=3093657 RepID=UPI002AC8C9CC|nr:single-stranded DNA-binding protein [Acutalibacter sp. M00118]